MTWVVTADPPARLLDAERRLSVYPSIIDLVNLEDLGSALMESDAVGEHVVCPDRRW